MIILMHPYSLNHYKVGFIENKFEAEDFFNSDIISYAKSIGYDADIKEVSKSNVNINVEIQSDPVQSITFGYQKENDKFIFYVSSENLLLDEVKQYAEIVVECYKEYSKKIDK